MMPETCPYCIEGTEHAECVRSFVEPGLSLPGRDAGPDAIEAAAQYVLDNTREGTSLNDEQRAADDAELMRCYRDIIAKALASGALSPSISGDAPKSIELPADPWERLEAIRSGIWAATAEGLTFGPQTMIAEAIEGVLSIPADGWQTDRNAVLEADVWALRYVLNFADSNTRVSTIMKAFSLPDRLTIRERLERLYAALRPTPEPGK